MALAPGVIHWLQIAAGLIILLVNSLIIIASLRQKKLRRAPYLYFGNLAGADSLLGFSLIMINFLEGYNSSYIHACLAVLSMLTLSSALSITFFILLARDRYIAVKYPISYRLQTSSRRTYLQVIGVWVGWILLTAIYCVVEMTTIPNNLLTGCYMSFFSPWYLFPLATFYFYCLIIALVVSLRIYWSARQVNKAVAAAAHAGNAESAAASNRRRQSVTLLKRLLVIWSLFMVMWTPFQVVIYMWTLCPDPFFKYPIIRCGMEDTIFMVPAVIAFFNSFINGIITIFIIPDIRMEIFKMIPCCRNSRLAQVQITSVS